MDNAIWIHPSDNVAVALERIAKGGTIHGQGMDMAAAEAIPAGHKFALASIFSGSPVIKYGYPIGFATTNISAGSHVHTHNLRTGLSGQLDYQYTPAHTELNSLPGETFQGFWREDGSVGVRNDIWVLPTVGCVNDVARQLATLAQPLVRGSIGRVIPFHHPYGCSQAGEDQETTRVILADLALHPNAGGVLLLGLGCENSGVTEIKPYLGDFDETRIRFLVCQQHEDELAQGLSVLKELVDQAGKAKRGPIPVEKLIIGLKCGGSDGLSGLTANPAIGGFSDLLIAKGGSAILTEVPEMFGAETLLMDRCPSEELFGKTVSLINHFKRYYEDHDTPVYENPSPGNKEGGISTLEEKSLGCVQKSGKAPVGGVLGYGEKVNGRGLLLLNAPGNDLIAATALAASGAQIVLFSTGRGTPFACPVPTVKISSNTALAHYKKNWIDFDAGRAANGTAISTLSDELYHFVLSVASGMELKHEAAGIHDMAIWKGGVTL